MKMQLSLAQRQRLREQGTLFQTGMGFGKRPLQRASTRIADNQSPENVLLPNTHTSNSHRDTAHCSRSWSKRMTQVLSPQGGHRPSTVRGSVQGADSAAPATGSLVDQGSVPFCCSEITPPPVDLQVINAAVA